jgi:hypothetical protein
VLRAQLASYTTDTGFEAAIALSYRAHLLQAYEYTELYLHAPVIHTQQAVISNTTGI